MDQISADARARIENPSKFVDTIGQFEYSAHCGIGGEERVIFHVASTIVVGPKEPFERGLLRGSSKICITDGVYMSRYVVCYVTCSTPLQANAMYWLPDVSKIQITRHSSSNDPS